MGGRKNKVAYFYDDAYAELYYGSNHPMKPLRMAMTHHLVLGYGLHEKLDVYEPRPAEKQDLVRFHEEDYIQFLSTITPTRATEHINDLRRFNLGEGDCPIFDDMWRFCRLYAGASVEAAKKLNHGLYDIAINWAGGLHHAKKAEASGFCYVNDLVLAILELLKYHARVLYIDVDIHHGDGVEEAFYLTDRVMTVSFHKYGMDFFPGTGALRDIGERRGRFYTVNVPLKDGTTDANFLRLFRPIMQKVMDVFQPQAIVMQCGADCLAKDRIGMWNMSLKGHAEAVKFMKGFGVPMLVTGGGGYTKTNVAKCWTYETAVLTNQEIEDELPETAYHQYFAPDFNLQVNEHGAIENQNKTQELEQILEEVFRNLSDLEFAPGVQFSQAPPDTYLPEYDLDHEQETVARLSTFCKEHQFIKVDDDTTNRHSLADY